MRHTEHTTVTVEEPGHKVRKFVLSRSLGRKVARFIADRSKPRVEKSLPAAAALPELADSRLRPATILRGARHKAGLTQARLAAKLGIRQHHLSEMENGKRPIGKQMARRLAKTLDCDRRLFF